MSFGCVRYCLAWEGMLVRAIKAFAHFRSLKKKIADFFTVSLVFSARRKQKKKKEIDKSFGIDWTGTASERDVRSQQGATGPAFTHSDKDDTLAPPCGSCAFGRAIEEGIPTPHYGSSSQVTQKRKTEKQKYNV